MKRRTFVEFSFLVSAGIIASPNLIACKKKNVNWSGKVAIIGGGAAGIRAAKHLHDNEIDYVLLEATDNIGGRVKVLNDFGDSHIELGAEYIHGKRSEFYLKCKQHGNVVNSEEDNSESLVLVDGGLMLESELENDADMIKLQRFIESIHQYKGADITLKEYAESNLDILPKRIHHLLDTLVGNDLGTSWDRIGLESLAKQENRWHAGNTDYLFPNDSFINVFREAYPEIINSDKVLLNWPVKKVDYTADNIIIENRAGDVITADKLIVAVPLPIIQDKVISFLPDLPTEKYNAANAVGMDSGMKVLLKFSHPFWEDNFGGLLTGAKSPEYWLPTGNSSVLTGFIMGEQAEYLSNLGENAIGELMAELDGFFPDKSPSSLLVDSHIEDWSKNEFVRGAYSYPKPGTEGKREVLAKSINKKVFFAGEATHYNGHSATVHGAMETGVRAAKEVISSL